MVYPNKIRNVDCLVGMSDLPKHSADIIIADPPYNIGKDFGNQSDKQTMFDYVDWSRKWMRLAVSRLKSTGTLFIYGFSEILAYLSVEIPSRYYRRWLIWYYTNKNTPHASFWNRSHEAILVVWKTDNRIFNVDDVREPYTETFLKNCAGKTRPATSGRFSRGGCKETCYAAHANGALPRDVLNIPALAGGAGAKERLAYCKTCGKMVESSQRKRHAEHELIIHPTQKPSKLTEKLILSARPQGQDFNVLIPFCGSGSECLVANRLCGNFVAFELNKDYVQLARNALKRHWWE